MGQITSFEANSFSDIQEIPPILWNLMIYYRIHKSPPLFPVLSQINQIQSSLNNYEC